MVHIHNRMLLPVYRAMFPSTFRLKKRLFSFTLQCLVCLFNGRGCGAGRVVKIDTVVRGGLGQAK